MNLHYGIFIGENFMRKILALVVCWLLAFSLGFTILPTGFGAIVNWLGPVFGTSLHLILSTIFILLADPLKYTTLAIVWAVVGFTGGLIIRKRVGSVLTMLTIYPAQSLVVALAGFRIYQIANAMGILSAPANALALLPPVPEGATLGTILNAPVVGDIYSRVQTASIQNLNFNFILNLLMQTIVLSIVKNILILCVSALVGCEIGKLLTRPFRPRIEAFRTRFSSASVSPATAPSKLFVGFMLILIALAAFTPAVLVGKAASASYYSETILGTLTPSGTAMVIANFFDNKYILQGVDLTNQAFSDCLSATLVAQKMDLATISSDLSSVTSQISIPGMSGVLDQALNMYPLLPQTILVLVYFDIDLSTAQARADQGASLFASKFGTSFTTLIATSQPANGHSFALVVYQSDSSFQTMSTNIMNTLPETQRDGLASFIGPVFRAGILTPGNTKLSANGTVISTGFLDYTMVNKIVNESPDAASFFNTVQPFLPTIGGPIPMISIGAYFAGMFHSSPITLHTLKFGDILNTSAPMTFSSSTNASTIITVVPTRNTTTPGVASIPIVKVATTLPTATVNTVVGSVLKGITGVTTIPGQAPPSSLISFSVTTIAKGQVVNPDSVAVTFTYRFPLVLRAVKTVSVNVVDRHQRVTVTITIYNDDTDAAQNVRLDDTASLSYYSQGAKLVSGTLTKSWPSIPNKTSTGPSSLSYSYDIELNKEGSYTLTPASVKYDYMGTTYTIGSTQATVQVRSPSLLQVFYEGATSAWTLGVSMLNMIQQVQGNGSMILIAVVAVLLALIVLNEYRNFKKWVKGPALKKNQTKLP